MRAITLQTSPTLIKYADVVAVQEVYDWIARYEP